MRNNLLSSAVPDGYIRREWIFTYLSMKKKSLFSFAVLLVVTSANSWSLLQAQDTAGRNARGSGSVLYSENFNGYRNGTLPQGWWTEGGQSVSVENGHLLVNADPKAKRGAGYVATVWLKKQFSGNIQIQFDARVVSSSIDTNNINFFLYFTQPGKDETLYSTRNLRLDGEYDHYYDLNGYIFTFVNPPNSKTNLTRFRLRRCPGFELLDQKFAHHSRQGETYHITIT
ncbi:MAG: DUF6250 domain-containing protein, partial [Acidobacteriaceae bacterium]